MKSRKSLPRSRKKSLADRLSALTVAMAAVAPLPMAIGAAVAPFPVSAAQNPCAGNPCAPKPCAPKPPAGPQNPCAPAPKKPTNPCGI